MVLGRDQLNRLAREARKAEHANLLRDETPVLGLVSSVHTAAARMSKHQKGLMDGVGVSCVDCQIVNEPRDSRDQRGTHVPQKTAIFW